MKRLTIILILSALLLTGCAGPKPSHKEVVKTLAERYDANLSFVEDEGKWQDGERLVIRDEDNGFDFTVFTYTTNGDPVPMPWEWHWTIREYYSEALLYHQLAEKYDNCTDVESDMDLYISKDAEFNGYMKYSLIIKAEDDDDISEILAECVDLKENGGLNIYLDFGKYPPIRLQTAVSGSEYEYSFSGIKDSHHNYEFTKEEFLNLSESKFREIMEGERVWEYDMEYFE